MNRVKLYIYAKETIEEYASTHHIEIGKYYKPNCHNFFEQLCGDIQDGSRISGYIGFYTTYETKNDKPIKVKDIISDILFGFDPQKTLSSYNEWTDLLIPFCENLPKRIAPEKNKIVTANKLTSWQRYIKGLYQGAEYLCDKYADVCRLEYILNNPPKDVEELKSRLYELRSLKNSIYGFGFTLCYNWIKECGAEWLAKPDIHITNVVNKLVNSHYNGWGSFVNSNPQYKRFNGINNRAIPTIEERIAMFMWEWTKEILECGIDPEITVYKLDRILYLFCSGGNFYLEDDSSQSLSESKLLSMIDN